MAVSNWEILADDGPVREWMKFDPSTGEMHFRREQVCDPILEVNKGLYAPIDERARWKEGLGDKVATIPLEVIEAYRKKGIDLMRDESALRRFLNDPDNRMFRTRPGRV